MDVEKGKDLRILEARVGEMERRIRRKKKDGWDRAEILFRAGGLVLIPVAVVVLGWLLNSALKERELEVEYVRLALSVLQSSDTTTALRQFAVDMLENPGPTPVPPILREAFLGGRVLLPGPRGVSLVKVVLDSTTPGMEVWVVSLATNVVFRGITPWESFLRPGWYRVEWRSASGEVVCQGNYSVVSTEVPSLYSCSARTGEITVRVADES